MLWFDSNLQAQEPQDMKNGTSIAVVSSDVDGGNRMTSELRIMPVDIIDMTIEEQESEGCSGFDSNLQAQEPQDMKNGTSIAVVSSDVDGGNRMTSDLRTIPPETERLSTEKLESEGCSGYVSQFEDGKLRESDAQSWEEAEQVDYDTEFEEEKSFVLEAESGEQELEVERISKLEPESSKFCKTGEALGKNSVSLKIRTVEVSVGETMKFDCLDRSNYDLRVDLSKESEKESLSCVEGSLSSDVQKSMSDSFNGSYPGTERDSGSDKFMWNGRSSQMRGRSPESAQFISPSANYWDSSKRDPPHIYHSAYNFGRPGLKSAFGNREYPIGTDQAPSDAAAGVARPDHRITRSDNFNGSYLRTERCSGSDKFVWSDRSSHIHGRGPESAQYFNPSANCWDYSKQEHPHIYHSPYNFGRPVSKSTFGNREYPMGTDQAPSDAAGVTRPDHRITRQFMDSYRPILRRRSPIERDEFYNMHLRRPTVKDTVRDTSTDRNRFRRYPQGVSRGIRDEYCRHVPDDDSSQCMSRIPHRLDRRERSISPHDRRPHHALPYKRARSGSRSRSPIDWLLQRDRNADSRRCNRPPDFRSDARIDGVRLPFTKRFGAGHGEFISSPGSHVSPQQNSRMFEDRNPGLDHFSGRKSHVRMQDQRFDQTRPVRRLNSDDYFNPMIRPRRFPDRAADGKGCSKYEVSEDM
ncbi:uncharacterized protein LOC120131609 [Hibiscus syriacus]|uniref:uncharacterized protein LOC120131609 n=1 Tax=Hibiscus syriacus TaxID=106335 RepID=UPI001924CDDA|nr:uncharacterized protein LOC120131609 [Hibiscus syriacus]XP_039004501.1 uncharacterized protein LOC120131609 [Hibiscus syriacus]